jgi:hypothetical protein
MSSEQSPKRRMVTSAAVVVGVLTGASWALSGCGTGDNNSAAAAEPVTDPRQGWVKVSDAPTYGADTSVYKYCDGATLVYVSDGYRSGGVAAVAGSPECKP